MGLVLLRRLQPYLWVASAVSVAYVAWVFTGRLFEHKKLQERAVRVAPSTPEFERVYGGNALKIVQFYARDGELSRGEKTLLCYGVINAWLVRIKPPVGDAQPALNRCFEISPLETTTYTLTAQGAKGASAASLVTVRVRINPR